MALWARHQWQLSVSGVASKAPEPRSDAGAIAWNPDRERVTRLDRSNARCRQRFQSQLAAQTPRKRTYFVAGGRRTAWCRARNKELGRFSAV